MKNYELFYLIYWPVFLTFIGIKSRLLVKSYLFFGTLFGLRKFYLVRMKTFRTPESDAWRFCSLDEVPARHYKDSIGSEFSVNILVEDLTKKSELENEFEPQYTFMAVTEKGQWRKDWCDDRKIKRKFTVAKENVYEMVATKVKLF